MQNAFRQQLAIATEQQSKKMFRKNNATFVKKPVPADGLCCYHSVLASLTYDVWCKVPRHSNGYAINSRTVKREEHDANEFRDMALSLSTEGDELLKNLAHRVSERSYVDIVELSWLGQVLDLAIRCTISDEAWFDRKQFLYNNKIVQYSIVQCMNTYF